MYEQVRQVVHDSGLWDNGRESSHGFILSPSVYEVSQEKRDELEAIGVALHDCLAGLGRIATIAFTPSLYHSTTWGMIAKVLGIGVPEIYHDIMLLNPSSALSICKVDLMESEDGNFRIAEIDGHNKHGLGYSTLAARIRKTVMPDAKVFPGVAAALAKEIERRGEKSVVLLYADQERFYLPEFCILKSELATHGIDVMVVAESDVRVESEKAIMCPDGKDYKLFVDLPFLYHNRTLNAWLAARYRAGEIAFLIPPKPFLGSKAILALLRNDTGDEQLEAILKSQIRPTSLNLLRQYIPETYLVHKREREEYWLGKCDSKRFVLKESISSGMKGVIFTDDPHFGKIMKCASDSFFRFILQGEVINRSWSFQHFTNRGYLQQGEWFVRVTVHYAIRHVADVVITARQDKKVHGAPDCLQLGSVII
ncbi:MAG: hypothetical protein HY981_04285 [Candidatus Magasanikbacteria bacterium]|nr:hypothetical protein [Candidatus Magasanikbacteria bacterium]